MALGKHLSFVLIPLMASGHIIPMIDMAKLLAQRGVDVKIMVTHLDATRFASTVDLAAQSGLSISLVKIRFPCEEAGLPPGCESADLLGNYGLPLLGNFFTAIKMLQQPLEETLKELSPSPSCIICDKHITWTADTCNKLGIPRIVFDGMSCFTQLVTHNLYVSKIYESVPPNEAFVVPCLPDKIEFTRLQLPGLFNPSSKDMAGLREEVKKTEVQAHGVVVNSFEELEKGYVEEFRTLRGGKVWCVGPLSVCRDKKENSHECLEWLDGRKAGSVVFACLGSLSRLSPPQFIELALGLEASNHPFILVVKGGAKSEEKERWISDEGIEERTKERGLFIRGWVPQVPILSHFAVGAFLTHCGWNSTLEGICAGLPMITWPIFAEQFLNEKLVVQILEIGVRVGARAVIQLGDEERAENKVMSDGIRETVLRVMDEREEGCERRERAKFLGEMAKKSVEEGGSSYLNITNLIQDIEELMIKNKQAVDG